MATPAPRRTPVPPPDESDMAALIPPHGGYRKLKSWLVSTIVYDATRVFCRRYLERGDRTIDQMIQAARSGRQNIAEGSQASGTSRKTEITLTNVARASLEELQLDCEDFLRQNGMRRWAPEDSATREIRRLAYTPDRSYNTYRPHIEHDAETAANTIICLVRQACYLLDRQLDHLEQKFAREGGFSERLHRVRNRHRGRRDMRGE